MPPNLLPSLALVIGSLAGRQDPHGAFEVVASAVSEHYRASIQYGAGGDLALARRELNAVLSADPLHTSARLRLTTLDDVTSQLISPATAIHLFRAVQDGLKEKYQDAIAETDTSIQLSPAYHEAYRLRGRTWVDLSDYDRAIQDYTKAIKLNPRGTDAYLNRANARAYKGDFRNSIADCNIAIEQAPANAEAYNSRGAVYAKQSLFVAALRDFDKALQLQPQLAPAYLNMALVYESTGQKTKELEVLRALVRNASPQYAALVEQTKERIRSLGGV